MLLNKLKSRIRRGKLQLKYSLGVKTTTLRLSNGNLFLLKNNDDICAEIYDDEKFEKKLVKKFVGTINSDSVVVDIGSNLGYFTVIAAGKITHPLGKVYSIEVNSELIKHQQRQLELNKFENVVLINSAVSDTKGTLPFYFAPEKYFGHSSLKENSTFKAEKVVEVNCTTIDELVQQYNIQKIDVIKIDVEGAEFNVLKGAINAIKNFRPTIFFESADHLTEGFSYTTTDLLCFLKSYNYYIVQVDCGMWFATPVL